MAQHAQPDGGPLGPYAISLIRTVVPLIWGHAVAYAISFGIPASFLATYRDVATEALGLVLTTAWYALWRLLEVRLPQIDTDITHVMTWVALGHPAAPIYATAPVPQQSGNTGNSTVNVTIQPPAP
jgi:hypothetical protein